MSLLNRIVESSFAAYGYYRDNPGGDWLEGKQEQANDNIDSGHRWHGMTGSITATMGMRKPMLLPVKFLRTIPGNNNERRVPGESQYDWLMKSVKEKGFDNSEDPVLIMVNHRGQAYLWEGNTRTAVANALAIPAIYAEVRWWNGGEDADGEFTPEKIAALAASVK